MYSKFIKRILDIICALLALIILFWLYALIALLVRIKLGSPIIFKQYRPGMKSEDGSEKIFCIYKFRTMTDEKDSNGNLLPDDARLTKFGEKLRLWSLDELPEVFNILIGDMSIVGPRPQLVRDMVFMTEDQRQRHNVRPGLSGLAQVNGRNSISWEGKLAFDIEYIKNITFLGDVKIILKTVKNVLKHEGITSEGQATVEDYGDVLLKEGKIEQAEYDKRQEEAKELLRKAGVI